MPKVLVCGTPPEISESNLVGEPLSADNLWQKLTESITRTIPKSVQTV